LHFPPRGARVVQRSLRFFGAALGRRLGVLISVSRGAPRDDVPIDFIRRRVRTRPS